MKKDTLQRLLKASPQELWDAVKKIEESIQGSLDEVEDLEDLIVESLVEEADEEKSVEIDLDKAKKVAKTKGLPPLDGEIVKRRMGVDFLQKGGETPSSKGMKGKGKAEDYYPTPEELAQINKYTNIDLKKEEVMVFTLVSAGQEVDRSDDQFTSKALKSMADRSPDKPYLMDHDWSIESVRGKIFDASVKNKQLIQKVYVPIREKNISFIQGMLDGEYNKVSVGFAMAPKDYVCSSCSKSLYSMECPHYPGSKDKEGNPVVGIIKDVSDYFEISNVAVPCQPEAGIRRSSPQEAQQKALDELYELSQNPRVVRTAEEKTVDRISNEIIPDGESPVSKETDKPEVTEEVSTPSEPEAVVEAKEVAPQEDPMKALVASLALAMKEAVAEAVAPLKEVTNKLEASLKEKEAKEVEVEDESTEDIARKLAATLVDNAPASVAPTTSVNFEKAGWAVDLTKLINQK